MEDFKNDRSNLVPVFEFPTHELESAKDRALSAGGPIAVDITEYPDGKSYVMADIFGNEFEITKFHDWCSIKFSPVLGPRSGPSDWPTCSELG